MGKDTLIDKLKSPFIRDELIKHIKKINTQSVAQAIHEHLDIQLTDKDVYAVKIAMAKKLEELKIELLK